ncbi:hypothetical protein EGT07_20025 [Herbaspirillum sp. HC18]|nr:hypothetical protein EGT07_20025 [Herbaspirillum sp. HC18]
MSNHPSDAGIPLLTEIIPGPPSAEVAPPAVAPASVVAVTNDLAGIEKRSTAIWDEAEWDKLEREVRERVLLQVLERVDFVLEQRVRDSLADVLQTAVTALADEIRSGLQNSMREVVTRAVTQELSKLQSSK